MVSIDAYDPEFVKDPYSTYARLRESSPVFYDSDWRLTFFTRYADVEGILKDRRFGRDFRHVLGVDEVDQDLYRRIYPPQYPMWTASVRDSFIDLEPPRHGRMRRLVSKAFTRRHSETYRPALEAIARAQLDAAVEKGEMEVIVDYATAIPVEMISELMGVPQADRPRLLAWSHAMVKVFDVNMTPAEGAAAEQATLEFRDYLFAFAQERRSNPRDDLMSELTQVEDDDERLTDEEIVVTGILVLNAGHEATVHSIGNAVLALIQNPGQFDRLREDPGLVRPAADELLRYDPPLHMFERWVLEDIEWHGHSLTKGTKVGVLLASANRDPDVFESPDQLDLARSPNPHLSYGAGIHRCVGAPLASVELEVAIAVLAERVRSMEVTTDELVHPPSLIFRGLERLPVALRAA